jgi:hypothetical protein
MSSPAEARADRLRQLEASILAEPSNAAPESPAEISEMSARAHRAIVQGTYGKEPTELRVRLHGDGVLGHQVPADQAGAVLRQTQLVVRWIGARLRTLGDEKQMPAKKGDRLAVKDATRLFLQPQFGAGSLVFDLVGADHTASEGDDDQGQVVDGTAQVDALLDRALLELLSIVDSSEADSPEALSELSDYVARMGPRVASQLKQLSTHVTEDEINIELRWRSPRGTQKRSNLTRRGALAIKDAVDRNRVRTDEVFITGLLETVSAGKDQVRIETPEEPFKMDVDAELGVTLGNLLHREVTARVERKTTWHSSGKETMDYRLLAVSEEPRLDEDDDGSESYVRPTPELPE